jgi:N-acetylated-alpha-linked acidic dipeptidase
MRPSGAEQARTLPSSKQNASGKAAAASDAAVPLGFSPHSFPAESRWETRYLKLPTAARCRSYLARLTSEPHVAGTPGDRRVSEFIAGEFRRDGFETETVEYRVLLSYPKKVTAELVSPDRVKLAHPEPPIPGDRATRTSDPLARMPWNGYSPSADIKAPVVYVNYGTAEDYDQLARLGVSVRNRIVLARYFHGYRGGKSLEAQKRGAAGVIVYSDPAEDGARQGPVYPDGPWGPLGHFQRGAVVYDFLVPGDPLTPGWASTGTARRIPASESRILPRIPMVPFSAADAREILARLKGPAAPAEWQGGLPLTYRAGDGSTQLHLALEMENRVTPIWNVVGKIRGSEEPDQLVVLSNHHDAWVYGAVDPASGTAAMLETARAFGQLLRQGFRPRRTVVFGNWDAEEYTLTGSTEWGEQFEDELRRNAVVCLNVDSATSGENLSMSLVPALLPAVIDATKAVRDPATGRSLYQRWVTEKNPLNIRSYAVPGATGGGVPFGILGGGSDFMVFLQHDGVPSLDMAFDGAYGVYHSLYDDFDWMEKFGDPGFRYHAAMSRLWGLLALRFADADLEPFDYAGYASEVAAYLASLREIAPPEFSTGEIDPLLERCRRWREAAAKLTAELETWRTNGILAGSGTSGDLKAAGINKQLLAEERTLLDPDGIPGRPWFRHLIYAPLPSYDAETLPGLREALTEGNLNRAREQARKLAEALDRAIEACRIR